MFKLMNTLDNNPNDELSKKNCPSPLIVHDEVDALRSGL